MIPSRVSRIALVVLPLLAAACTDRSLPVGPVSPAEDAAGAATHVEQASQGVYDDFAGARIDSTKWIVAGPQAWVTQNDRLVVTLAPSVAEVAGLRTRAPESLIGRAFSAEISQSASIMGTSATETFFSLITLDGEEFIVISSINGNLTVWYKQRGQTHRQLGASVTFNPVNHRFRRIREQGGTIFVETSANGQSWTRPSGWSLQSFFTNPNAVHINLGARARTTSNTSPATAVFENVNTLVPAIPSNLAASAASASQINLSWQDRSVNETGFRIERRLAGGTFAQVASVGAGVTSYQDGGLQAGTAYEYRVRAYNGSGNSAFSNTASAITEPPPGPRNPLIGTLTDDFAGALVNLGKWGYYHDPQRTRQDDRLIVTLPRTQAGYGGLISAAPHSFEGTALVVEISQVAAGGRYTETFMGISSVDQEEYVVITSLNGRIGAYAKWRGQGWFRYQLAADLPYDPVRHRFRRLREQGGRVYFELSADGQSWMQPPGWSVAHAFTDLHSLHAVVGAGAHVRDANAGTAIFENVNTLVPAIPSNLAASAASASQINLSWQDRSVNETGFRIERRLAGGTFAQVASVGAGVTSYQDGGLQAGTAYEYRVRAYNGSGNSGYTNTAGASTEVPRPAPPPARLQ